MYITKSLIKFIGFILTFIAVTQGYTSPQLLAYEVSQSFFTDSTFVVPNEVDTVWITLWAGGGSGGNYARGGGGGSGSGIMKYPLKVTPGVKIEMVIGKGGNANNSDGGNSYVMVNGSKVLETYGGAGACSLYCGGIARCDSGDYCELYKTNPYDGGGGGGAGGKAIGAQGGIGLHNTSMGSGGDGGHGVTSPSISTEPTKGDSTSKYYFGGSGGGNGGAENMLSTNGSYIFENYPGGIANKYRGGGAGGFFGNGGNFEQNAPANSGAGGGGTASVNPTLGGDGGCIISWYVKYCCGTTTSSSSYRSESSLINLINNVIGLYY